MIRTAAVYLEFSPPDVMCFALDATDPPRELETEEQASLPPGTVPEADESKLLPIAAEVVPVMCVRPFAQRKEAILLVMETLWMQGYRRAVWLSGHDRPADIGPLNYEGLTL
jgi:hypothetical protein